MEGNYAVYLGNEQIGKVQILRQGLYFIFHCRCRLSRSEMCRLTVTCAEHTEDLGILVPMDGGFGLDTRMPVKRLREGKPDFRVVPRHSRAPERFVPIIPEEPFTYIERLKDGYLARQNGQLGMMLAEK